MSRPRVALACSALLACAGDGAETISAAGSGAAPPTTSSGVVGTECDTGAPGNYATNDPVCNACIACTELGPCASLWEPCIEGSGRPCDLFTACIDVCFAACDENQSGTIQPGEASCFIACAGDEAQPLHTPGNCIGDNVAGYDMLLEALGCAICLACPANCGAATNCG
jgi:hypothetical protein